ncbi:hypothetical protein, partial [Klebsiella aerogenes]|uniref:hypothetical protein n=1 Tax=Klebsiella aerogenes TaxID=548 RepID=UPI001954336D
NIMSSIALAMGSGAGIDGGISVEGTIACIIGGIAAAYLGCSLIFSELWGTEFIILGIIGLE